MHERLIVLLDHDKKKVSSSRQAREYVFSWLLEQGFVSQGMFAQGRADWFVIGGRWSGELTLFELNPIVRAALEEKLNENPSMSRAKIERLFREFFPQHKGPVPFSSFRQHYNYLGADDDAKIVSKRLWDNLIKNLVKNCKGDVLEDPLIYIGGNVEDLTEDKVVDKLWAVVVDYHY